MQVLPPPEPPGIDGDWPGCMETRRTRIILAFLRDRWKIEISPDRFSRLALNSSNHLDLHTGPRSRRPAATLEPSIHLDFDGLLGLVWAALSPHRSLRGT